jgi:hypothetical protein
MNSFDAAHFNTAKCRSCGAYIVWLKTKAGKNMPVDADSLDDVDLEAEAGEMPLFDPSAGHISHFATCPNADQHRRK